MEINDLLKQILGDSYSEGMTDDEIKERVGAAMSKHGEKPGKEEVKHLKELISKANSEAAKYKKELNAHLTEEEKKKAQQEEEVNAMREELATLKRGNAIASSKASLISLGYDEELAQEQASAMVDNDIAKVMEIQRKFIAEHDKKIAAQGAASMGRPNSGNPSAGKTFSGMTLDERMRLKADDPQAYETLKAAGQ